VPLCGALPVATPVVPQILTRRGLEPRYPVHFPLRQFTGPCGRLPLRAPEEGVALGLPNTSGRVRLSGALPALSESRLAPITQITRIGRSGHPCSPCIRPIRDSDEDANLESGICKRNRCASERSQECNIVRWARQGFRFQRWRWLHAPAGERPGARSEVVDAPSPAGKLLSRRRGIHQRKCQPWSGRA